MNLPLLLILATLAPGTAPDKFWLETETAGAIEGSRPRCIEGVLLRQDETHYYLRVEGGEIGIEKASVVKIEQDGLTVDKISRSEKDAAAKRAVELAAAEHARQQARAAAEAAAVEAAAARADDFGPADAVELVEDVPMLAAPEPLPAPTYDPVLHVVRGPRESADAALLRDLEIAYRLTRDRAYIKVIRRLRRLR